MNHLALPALKRVLRPLLGLFVTLAGAAEPPSGSVVDLTLRSTILEENRIGLDPERHLKVYLPPGYEDSDRRYPVVYYCHNFFWSPAQLFADGVLPNLLEEGFASGVVPAFILVAPDYTSPTTGSLYENSPTSGRWLDHTVEEVVPLIDRSFRTLPSRESRAVVGDFFGGRGALQLVMLHAPTFASAYALHPVATGPGDLPWSALDLDWRRLREARSFAELPPGGRERIFLAIFQGFLPEASAPPFFCTFPGEEVDGVVRLDPTLTRLVQARFHLDESLDAAAPNLRSLRGLALDWGRFDPTRAHVQANRQFSVRLADLGIPHEAEEYAGGPWDQTWTENGRFAARVLPFLARTLVWPPPGGRTPKP